MRRAQRALAAGGAVVRFTYEGTQEAHVIVKGDRRDTAWFRVLERAWQAR